jgi:hypothetical protein
MRKGRNTHFSTSVSGPRSSVLSEVTELMLARLPLRRRPSTPPVTMTLFGRPPTELLLLNDGLANGDRTGASCVSMLGLK